MRKFFKKWVKGWTRQESGTTAIEFAFLAMPYMLLTVGIIELSIMYTAASLLEGATGSAARLIRTGQIQNAEGVDPEDMFREAICEYATVLINCDNVVIEVQPMESFADYEEIQPQYDEDGNLISGGFEAGGSNDKMLIRVAYRYHMMTPLIGPLLTGPTSSRLFVSTIVLQTEPYEFEGA